MNYFLQHSLVQLVFDNIFQNQKGQLLFWKNMVQFKRFMLFQLPGFEQIDIQMELNVGQIRSLVTYFYIFLTEILNSESKETKLPTEKN